MSDRANLSNWTDGQEITMEQQIKTAPDKQNVRNLRSQGVIFKKVAFSLHFLSRERRRHSQSSLYGNWIKNFRCCRDASSMPLLLRLSNIPNISDAVANGVQYHRKYWVGVQQKADVEKSLPQELENVNPIVPDIEIQDIVVNLLKESTESVTDMKSLNATYINLLGTNEVNCKRYLKQLLLENVPGVQFVRPPARNQSERVCYSRTQSSAV